MTHSLLTHFVFQWLIQVVVKDKACLNVAAYHCDSICLMNADWKSASVTIACVFFMLWSTAIASIIKIRYGWPTGVVCQGNSESIFFMHSLFNGMHQTSRVSHQSHTLTVVPQTSHTHRLSLVLESALVCSLEWLRIFLVADVLLLALLSCYLFEF